MGLKRKELAGRLNLRWSGRVIAPSDQAEVGFDLMKPVGLEKGVCFAIREGGKTVSAGLVTAVTG